MEFRRRQWVYFDNRHVTPSLPAHRRCPIVSVLTLGCALTFPNRETLETVAKKAQSNRKTTDDGFKTPANKLSVAAVAGNPSASSRKPLEAQEHEPPASETSAILVSGTSSAPQTAKQGPPTSGVQVAVIGDVGTDWLFISDQPSRPAGPHGHPWTQSPATNLFALPGGAWLSGHMIQGALAAPIFHRRYSALISRAGKDKPAAVTLGGTLKWATSSERTQGL